MKKNSFEVIKNGNVVIVRVIATSEAEEVG